MTHPALAKHLGAHVHAAWRGGDRKATAATFAAALATDEDLRRAARARHSELKAMAAQCLGQLERRCSVSAEHLKALDAVLT